MARSRKCARLRGLPAALFLLSFTPCLHAQDIPLVSGGVGFLTSTNGGNTTYIPRIDPLIAAPLGKRLLFEGRASLNEIAFPNPGKGYDTTHFIGVNYMQADFFVDRPITLVGGYFLTPFGTYNERLTPFWINNLQDAPLIFPIGTMNSASGLGGELRGNAFSNGKVSITYAAYMAAGVTNEQIVSSRSAGGQVGVYFPKARLEVGASYGRLLEHDSSNSSGFDVWWEPEKFPLKLRSEYAHGAHSQGYWIEGDYRLSQFGGEESAIGRLQPVIRVQQSFRNSAASDGLPSADTQRLDLGIDYFLPRDFRINTSYSRQFSATGNTNIWETALIYRFVLPTWKGKKQ